MNPAASGVHRAEIAAGFALATIVAVSSGACAAKAPQLSTAPRIAHHATTTGVLPGSAWSRWRPVRSRTATAEAERWPDDARETFVPRRIQWYSSSRL